ncbi:MAG TPA: hypothetical protein VGG39_09560 [Polyangiaceae bacterium]|jgi:hypothetical protein
MKKLFCALGLAALLAAGCKDQAKESAARASTDVSDLAALVEKDLGEVERGLPQGAKKLEPLVSDGADPKFDPAGVRTALQRVRRDVMDLSMAKSTFFALTDANGVAIRNDLEEDVMAGQNLFSVFPALAAAKSTYTTTTGLFPNATTKNGPDRDWIAGFPVKRTSGETGAIFVTGWTYRYFARHLQESLKDRLAEEAKKSGDVGRIPVFYVAVFDKTGVYAAPLTPQVDEKALADAGLLEKTAAGPAQGPLTITDRAFGWAAVRTPHLAPDTGIVVLRSEL